MANRDCVLMAVLSVASWVVMASKAEGVNSIPFTFWLSGPAEALARAKVPAKAFRFCMHSDATFTSTVVVPLVSMVKPLVSMLSKNAERSGSPAGGWVVYESARTANMLLLSVMR